jgi:hypothetical protein
MTHLIKTRHRLIRTPNLHLKVRCLIAVTAFSRTLHLPLLRIIPRARPAEYIFAFCSREGFALEVAFGEEVLVGAGQTFEAVLDT